MKIAFIGTGYVGTVAGACFAAAGNEVVCVDKEAQKVILLSNGNPVIYEPGLEELLRGALERRTIRFTTSIREATDFAEVIFMTVGTPSTPEGGADLSFLREATFELGRNLKKPAIIVNKSTVPVGTHRDVASWLRQAGATDFDVVSNPEFLREGAAVRDFLFPERVVIGTRNAMAFRKMKELYSSVVPETARIIEMDPVSAELTKYACNAFLATRISFMNELALLCEKVGGDIEAIRQGMATDSRIGSKFLNAGLGYGGSCFPKDIRALLATSAGVGMEMRIVQATEDVNDAQKRHLLSVIESVFGNNISKKTFALWGLAFKPCTDDVREAPALTLIQALTRAGARVRAFDPVAMDRVAQLAGGSGLTLCRDPIEAARGADAVIVATEWEEFRKTSLKKLSQAMKGSVILDGRNFLSPQEVIDAGLSYYAIGRGRFGELKSPPRDLFFASEALSA